MNFLPRLRIGGVVQASGIGALHHNDPWSAGYFADGSQWGPRVIQADRLWKAGFQGSPNVRVAILDTGIDYDNRELRGLVDLGASASFSGLIAGEAGVEVTVPVEPQVPGDAPYMDNHMHGTHVASTVASNAISVAGVAPHVTLIAVKVLNFQGSGSFESVATGIRYAAGSANADVINMSLGAGIDMTLEGADALIEMMRRTIAWAEKQGTIVISAAGNDAINLDQGNLVYTPCEQSTLCVSATGPLLQQNFDQPATYTNYGITAVDIAAPGGNATTTEQDPSGTGYQTEDLIIGACSRRTTDPQLAPCRLSMEGSANGTSLPYFYVWAAGTSMATPHVAGVAALLKSHVPTLSVTGIRDRLLKRADDVHTPGKDVYTNWGRVNAWRAM
jgi:subtilisin family serine protease